MSRTALTAGDFVESLRDDSRLAPELVGHFRIEGQAERRAEFPGALPTALSGQLPWIPEGEESPSLWTHQAEALNALEQGQNVLITTPTASGKSAVFQLPVLTAASRGEPGRALWLFPLKALGRDQQDRFARLAEQTRLAEEATCAVYDGDTSQTRRRQIRGQPPRVLITNPDMLHLAMLGYPEKWEEFFAELRWIVLDELHAYRGIFGAHLHHLLVRLRRRLIPEHAAPRYVASSATAAHADRFAQKLTGLEFHWVQESGAPREGRHLLLLSPLRSPYTTTLHLLTRLLDDGLKTIVFTKARRITELLWTWLRRQRPDLAERVASYRSGFLPEERREIEVRLFRGDLVGVIATSALEMGIDVGGLDACVLVGYPGSVMATWQRSGRAGRGGRESITALVALPDALDHYLLAHPEMLLESPCERLVVDPDNERVVGPHLVCAAAERPLDRVNDRDLLQRHAATVGELLRQHELREDVDTDELVTARRRPQRLVNLRGTGGSFAITRVGDGEVVGVIDAVRARTECHPGAIYLHAGRSYKVGDLDLGGSLAVVESVSPGYYTMPLTSKEITILEVLESRRHGALALAWGRLRVSEQVVGYERRRLSSRELLGRFELDLPPMEFETEGLWWLVPAGATRELERSSGNLMGSMHATEHAAIGLAPLEAICDRGELGGISLTRHPQLDAPAVFIYDGHPGGLGIAQTLFSRLPVHLERTREMIASCECEAGCPRCIQSPKCGNGNRPLDRAGAERLLELLLGEEEFGVASAAGLAPDERETRSAAMRRGFKAQSSTSKSRDRPRPRAPEPTRQDGGGPTVLFDLETLRSAEEVGGWDNSHKMGVAIGVALEMESGEMVAYREAQVPELIQRLETAALVVGFNIRRFDYRVLSGYTGIDYADRLPTLDLLEEIHRTLGFRLSLGHLAQTTLGVEKSADGLQSLEWVRQGRMDLVEEYCRHDVELVRDLYLFGRREGHLLYRDRRRRRLRVRVKW